MWLRTWLWTQACIHTDGDGLGGYSSLGAAVGRLGRLVGGNCRSTAGSLRDSLTGRLSEPSTGFRELENGVEVWNDHVNPEYFDSNPVCVCNKERSCKCTCVGATCVINHNLVKSCVYRYRYMHMHT